MKPEWHINGDDGCYFAGVKVAKEKGNYIEAFISKEDLGYLLQGKYLTLLFLNDRYEPEGQIDIKLSDGETRFEVSDKINNLILGEEHYDKE